MFNTILVAVDESDAAKSAVELACRLAKEDGAKLLLVNVVDVSKLVAVAGYETPYPIDAIQMMRDSGADLLNKQKSTCESGGLNVTTAAGEGDACDEILRLADENKVGLICMGTHGRKGLAHLFIGSVAEGVVRRSKVPVMVTPS
ncbi:MAG TPA: universal stress protein [Candidatus Baltobacteraceae bacterium]|nr:universal stress protein [Candidatus Baltobacteraceae bacterium]